MSVAKQSADQDRNNSQDLRLRTRFKAVTTAISQLAADEGQEVTPFFHPGVPYFSRLDEANKRRVVDNLERILDVCQQIVSEGGDVMSGHKPTWRLLRYMRYVPRHDVLNAVKEDHIVEIYSLEGKILFASMNFFKLNYYSLEDVYCRPWFELYERDSEILRKINETVQDLLDKPEQGTVQMNLPVSPIQFNEFPDRPAIMIRTLLFSPIFRDQEFVGMIDVLEHQGFVDSSQGSKI